MRGLVFAAFAHSSRLTVAKLRWLAGCGEMRQTKPKNPMIKELLSLDITKSNNSSNWI